MPLTFIDIEKQKSWRIVFFLIVLFGIYFAVILALTASFTHFLPVLSRGILPGVSYMLTILLISVALTSIHFFFTSYNAVSHIKSSLGALKPDRDDEIHKQLMNITDEIRIATGSRKNFECLVIPNLSMNALSAVDLQGNTLIAITEGLLSRIARPQLEAVMAHEAHHILSGDCFETTIASSLFGVPSAVIEKIQRASRGRAFMSPPFILAWLLVKIGYILNLFISREREYRADAGAVRITRNPIALAEVLYMLSRNWNGSGQIGSGLEMLCVVNPDESSLDESEGFIANMLSTHPPVRTRINILLNMTRVSFSELEQKKKLSTVKNSEASPDALYYVLDNKYQWQGPFTLRGIAELPWFSTLTWVSKGGNAVQKASQIEAINSIFRQRISGENSAKSSYMCPLCQHPLFIKPYEKTTVFQCNFCGGILTENEKIPRIIARTSASFSDRIKSLARVTLTNNQSKKILKSSPSKTPFLINCPKCKNKMMRTFYSLAYLIELDKCTYCGITWFDPDELDILQCMIDNKMAGAQPVSCS